MTAILTVQGLEKRFGTREVLRGASFAVHERTFYTQYRYVGPPREAVNTIRAELGKLRAAVADP